MRTSEPDALNTCRVEPCALHTVITPQLYYNIMLLIVVILNVTNTEEDVKIERPMKFIKIVAVWRYKICSF